MWIRRIISRGAGRGRPTGGDGTISIADNTTLSLTSAGLLSGTYTLLTFAETVVSYETFATILLDGSASNWTNSGYPIDYGTTGISIVPEPSAIGMITAGLALLVVFRKRTSTDLV